MALRCRKALASRKWEDLDRHRLRYEMTFTDSAAVSYDRMHTARDFARGNYVRSLLGEPRKPPDP